MGDAILYGLAAAYIWYVVAESVIGDKPFGWARERFPLLVGCPYCSAFWVTGCITVVTGYDFITHLAAAMVAGLVGAKVAHG